MNHRSAPEDTAFCRYVAERSPESLVRLLDAYRTSVFNWCYQVLEHRQDAEDVSQRVLLQAATHAPEFSNACAFRGWICRVCLTKSLNHRRGRARRVAHESRKTGAPSNGHHPEWGDRESRLALLQAVEELPDEDRALILERYFDGDALQLMADRRGCSKVAIWNRLRRIRDRLRRQLRKAGLGAALLDMEFWLGALRFPARPDSTRPGPVVTHVRPISTTAGRVKAALWTVASLVAALVVSVGLRETPRNLKIDRYDLASLHVRPSPTASLDPGEETPTRERVEPAAAPIESTDDKEHVRWLYQKTLIQIRTGTRVIWESSTEIERFVKRIRQAHRDPALHAPEVARFMGLLYRIGAEESGLSIPAEGVRRMHRLQAELETSLRELPSEAGLARLQATVEADLAFARGMAEILPREGPGSMMFCVIDRILKRGSSKSMPREHLLREIVTDWSAVTPPDGAVHARIEQVADELASQLDRITREFGTRDEVEPFDDVEFVWSFLRSAAVRPYDPIRRMEHQVECLKAAGAALESVRRDLEPTTWKRFAEAEPWTYAVTRPGINGVVDLRE